MAKPGFKIKNHISPKAKRLTNLLPGKFGIDIPLLDKALKGDQKALQIIGEAGRQGALTQELMPILSEAYLNCIKGTEEYNKGVALITKQGATSAINIDKAVSATVLAGQKYDNQRKELKGEYVAAKTSENLRHQYAVNYIRIKAYVDQYLQRVDGDSKIIDQSNRPEIKQIDENARYEVTAAKHLLQHGDNANLGLIPRRQYNTVVEGDKAIPVRNNLSRLGSTIASALGF
jgi:hypothetical protein